MYVIDMLPKIGFITDEMLPKASLRQTTFTSLLTADGNPFSFYDPAGEMCFYQPLRVEKSESPGSNVRIQCKCSGRITIAFI